MMRLLGGRGPAAPEPERFTLDFACAATDRTFTGTFLRRPGERLYRLETMAPVERGGLRARALAMLRGGGAGLRVDVAEIDGLPDPCPGCGLSGQRHTLCAWCKAFVCAARSRGDRFECRPSCGVSFRTTPMHALDARRGGGPASGDAGGAPRLSGPSPKLLPRR